MQTLTICGISDHYLVEAKVTFGSRVHRRRAGEEKIINVSNLNEKRVAKEYRKQIEKKWEVKGEVEERSVNEERQEFKEVVLTCAKATCYVRKLGKKKRKNREW